MFRTRFDDNSYTWQLSSCSYRCIIFFGKKNYVCGKQLILDADWKHAEERATKEDWRACAHTRVCLVCAQVELGEEKENNKIQVLRNRRFLVVVSAVSEPAFFLG